MHVLVYPLNNDVRGFWSLHRPANTDIVNHFHCGSSGQDVGGFLCEFNLYFLMTKDTNY